MPQHNLIKLMEHRFRPEVQSLPRFEIRYVFWLLPTTLLPIYMGNLQRFMRNIDKVVGQLLCLPYIPREQMNKEIGEPHCSAHLLRKHANTVIPPTFDAPWESLLGFDFLVLQVWILYLVWCEHQTNYLTTNGITQYKDGCLNFKFREFKYSIWTNTCC